MMSTPLIRSIISWKIKDFSLKSIFYRLPEHSHKDAKKIPIMQKVLHDASKNTFCSVENPGSYATMNMACVGNPKEKELEKIQLGHMLQSFCSISQLSQLSLFPVLYAH